MPPETDRKGHQAKERDRFKEQESIISLLGKKQTRLPSWLQSSFLNLPPYTASKLGFKRGIEAGSSKQSRRALEHH
jgi:hypothetical protein